MPILHDAPRRRRRRRAAVTALAACAALALSALLPQTSAKEAAPPQPAPATRPATAPSTAPAAGWRTLFDGKTLAGWESTDFAGHGEPKVEDGNLVIPFGEALTGVTYTGGGIPKVNYEVSVEAQRVDGSDFFCALTFPVGESFASLIVGGWGGSVVGISSLDDQDAAHNETTDRMRFEKGRWYRIRLRVQADHLTAWIDEQKVIDVATAGKKVSLRQDIEAAKPFSIATFQTTGAVREVKVRELKADEVGKGK